MWWNNKGEENIKKFMSSKDPKKSDKVLVDMVKEELEKKEN